MPCSVVHPLDCLDSAAKAAAGDVFASIARDFGQAADATITWLWGQMAVSTAVHLGGTGFNLDLGIVAAITGTVAVGLFMIQVITSTLRHDPGGLSRAFKGLVVAFVAGGVAIAATNVLLDAVDALSNGVVMAAMGTNINQMGPKVLDGGAILTVGDPAGMILLSVAAIAAVVVVWFALMVRKVLIVVSAVFAPLAFAGSLADITVTWTRKWIETMVALVVSKLILVVIFVVGWGVLDHGTGQTGRGGGQTITQTASGLLILGVAGLSPWMALKLVHFSGDQFHHLHSLGGAASGGARAAVAAPQKAAGWKSAAGAFAAGGRPSAGAGGVALAASASNVPRSPPGSGSGGAAPPGPGGAAPPGSGGRSAPVLGPALNGALATVRLDPAPGAGLSATGATAPPDPGPAGSVPPPAVPSRPVPARPVPHGPPLTA